MTEQERDKNITGHDPNREHMTLSALWSLWMDNLKSWRQFGEEHADLFTLNIQAGFRRIGDWLGRVRRSARTLAAERKDKRFPESELAAAQLFLFLCSSVERLGAKLRERFSRRRKALARVGGQRRSYFEEKLQLHPVAFLSGAVCIAAAAVVLYELNRK